MSLGRSFCLNDYDSSHKGRNRMKKIQIVIDTHNDERQGETECEPRKET